MTKPGPKRQPRTQREVLQYGKKLGGVIEEGSKHLLIVNPKTGAKVPVQYSTGDIPRGTLRNIMNMLKLVFVAGIFLCIPTWCIVRLFTELVT